MYRLPVQLRRALLGFAAAFAVSIAGHVVQPSPAAADQFIPSGGGWQVYVNDRFGTSFSFPADIFTPSPPPENGDGRRFVAPDATLEVYAWHNAENETAASLKRRLVGSDGYTDVTYSPTGRSWLVLSGYRGDNIFYEKYFFRSGTVHGFGIEFPAQEKPFYAPIIERIEDSFQAS
ncbi:MAG TPA: hypothetical protein VHG92_11555 [Afifellaceae bacterium]|nr:hypothetical protein [Afifellaceae bacterium]